MLEVEGYFLFNTIMVRLAGFFSTLKAIQRYSFTWQQRREEMLERRLSKSDHVKVYLLDIF